MAKMIELEVWVVYDENGDYAVSIGEEADAFQAYRETITTVPDLGLRSVLLSLTVPAPTTIVADVVVPDPGDETPKVEVKAA